MQHRYPIAGVLYLACLFFSVAAGAQMPLASSGLPVPRFVSLKSDETNVRTGPGDRYPISWVYKRSHFPVEIIEEFDHWRKIRDVEKAEGWVHKSLLDGRRTALVQKNVQVLRRAPEENASPILRAEPMVIGKLIECTAQWCRLQVGSRKGWLQKKYLWGVYAKEEFAD